MPHTVRLDDDLAQSLEDYCRATGRSRNEVVRDALRRHLRLFRLEQFRRELIPFAEARGYFTDEDIFRIVS
ncbi:MAG TPA: ribbon-helix-helix protein, CopG family [Longimicrobiaceae bacterium]